MTWFTCSNVPLAYLNIHKSASTTIRNVMHFLDNGFYPEDHLSVHRPSYRTNGGTVLDDPARMEEILAGKHCTFTFIRDPKERAWSCFCGKIVASGEENFTEVREFLEQNYDFDEDRTPSENFAGFIRFVDDNLSGNTPLYIDDHWMPQSAIISGVEIDFLGTVCRLQEGFDAVLMKVGILPVAIPKFHLSQLAFVPDEKTEGLLREIYADDYRTYEGLK